MQEERIGSWLEELASAAPAPGGGAVAAMASAMAAGLVEMVANLTVGRPRYAESEPLMRRALERAGELRLESLRLAAEDAEAFAAVADAYRLPRTTDEEKVERSGRIQEALVGAASVPARTAAAAARIVDLAEEILPGANVNVISDVAAAASSARAALECALVNVEVNRGAITDEGLRSELGRAVDGIEKDVRRADTLVAAVRSRLVS
ncbi:MAG TPA: cyclodeaminase/cyclohydrolase family protein [Candidatus Dormibacteraeota bacterium]|nr:cyclodeaminase/cyclohydrolase family protein [Candidatus Dormibacteraeota bacterium]